MTAVETTSGRLIPTELVVCGIGVVPNAELAADAGLDVQDGIRVDQHLLTADPDISAIGDVAFFPSPLSGRHVRIESVQNATDQARCVAARIAKKPSHYGALPWFWSDQGGLKLQIAGLRDGCDESVLIGSVAQQAFSVLCFRQQRLIAIESVNQPGHHMAARKILARQSMLTPKIANEGNFDIKAWATGTN